VADGRSHAIPDRNKHRIRGLRGCRVHVGWRKCRSEVDVESTYQKMSATEKEIFKKKMAEIDEADAGGFTTHPYPRIDNVQ
jgi:hypothetical protein